MQVHVIGPNLRDQSKGSFHVHAAGCADVRRSPQYRGPDFQYDRENTQEAASVTDLAEDVYQDQIAESEYNAAYGEEAYTTGQYNDDFYVFPCAAALAQ